MTTNEPGKSSSYALLLIAITLFSLLSAVLLIVGAASPWIKQGNVLYPNLLEYHLLYVKSLGIKFAEPTNSAFFAFGASSTALLSIAVVASCMVLVFAGVLLQKALEHAQSPYAGYLSVPRITASIGAWPSLPRAMTGFAWTAMVCAAGGVVLGIFRFGPAGGVFFSRSDLSLPGYTVTYVGCDATIAGAVSSLISALLASIAGVCCCCGKRGSTSTLTSAPKDSALGVIERTRQSADSNSTSAPNDTSVGMKNPLPSSLPASGKNEWLTETDGSQTWYLNLATGETRWTLPAGATLRS